MYLITASVLGLIALVGLLVLIFGKKMQSDDRDALPVRPAGLTTFIVASVLLGLVTAVSSFTMVEARTVSVETAFGKYVGVVNPGPNWTAPWAQFESFSTTVQPTDLNDFDNEEQKGDAVVVSFSAPRDPNAKPDAKVLAGGGSGAISAIVSWKVKETGGEAGTKALWEKYRTFEAVSLQLVKAKAQDTISDVANDMPANEATVNQTQIGVDVKTKLTAILSPFGIEITDVSIKRIILDPATQASLQKIVDAINKTAAATEEAKAAAIQNTILKDRAAAGALDQKANDRYCLDIVKTWDFKDQGQLPATFNCGVGSGASGVLVQTK